MMLRKSKKSTKWLKMLVRRFDEVAKAHIIHLSIILELEQCTAFDELCLLIH